MLAVLVHITIVTTATLHILLRRNRQPESRMAWLVVVMTLPYLGALAYLLLGQTSVGRKRIKRLTSAFNDLPRPPTQNAEARTPLSAWDEALFRVGRSISGYEPVSGNHAKLMKDSDAAIDSMVADIDAARDHVHLVFYIWLDDGNGNKIADALMRAAARGVTCRAMVDDIGSRALVKTPLWRKLSEAGVHTRTALPVGNPFLRILDGRIDLRNHRKVLVIDNAITYCGSQNCADPAFLPKAKFAPWFDAVMRFTGPVVRQNQHLFASDWMGNGGDDITEILKEPVEAPKGGFFAQVVATGPTFRASAMPEMFESLIYSARRSVFITTPYYVPTQALQAAICAAGNRGVDVTIIFPARNDDFAVGATCRSHYESLLEAGVKVHEFQPGLLHTKSLTVDGDVTLIGSANMDRRSFDLNYENNILLHDPQTTAAMRARQEEYLAQSRPITLEEVRGWSMLQRLKQNALAIVGPIL
ncbi:cardiolipin synthase [Nitratireductor aquimarinus]|uniref:cardiolipin synthase n=1 Tax=Alphaproteobacteria TaxID=28211 RepID=UPI0019D38C30|nr:MULTISPECIES: cardiolipin synthase [Alphaproteobacteria]MBN7757784.1 cardiolipin synthase [Nitratireductor aquimarinus]MBY6000546.1 cardiolipin synthase [Tritonibacter mobilis]MBY6022575.1 cardiolipin synthase [Nitratireductor sp. DP7N14-4]